MRFINRNIFLLALAGLVLFGAGVFAGRQWKDASSPASGDIQIRPIRAGIHNTLTSPLIGFDVPESLGLGEYRTANDAIVKFFAEQKDKHVIDDASVYFRRINSGTWFGVNEDADFSPASMLKITVAMAYYKIAEFHPEILNRTVLYDGSFDKNTGSFFKPLHNLEAGKQYAISDLLDRMLRYSDNNANYLLLTDHGVGAKQLSELFSFLNMPPFDFSNDFDSMTAKNYSNFFRALYNTTYLDMNMSEKLLETLATADFKDGIIGGIPASLTAAHKFGERSFPNIDGTMTRELHDCGIIYYPNHPYFLCVMTKGTDFQKLSGIIKHIAELVYQDMQDKFSSETKK